MKKAVLLWSFVTCLVTTRSAATTWDEPWADKVIKEASSFVLAKIISVDADKGVKILVIKTLGGKDLKDTIVITGFYLLKICSSSGHGAEFEMEKTDSCYFFIQQNTEGKYRIATPSTGFDYVQDGQVSATYRHSYHQASVPATIYEKTMAAVFSYYHNTAFDSDYIRAFVNEQLGKSPAGFGEIEIHSFFLQHVALELVHHLRLKISGDLLLPFLNDTSNFHNQVSAARAMVAVNTAEVHEALLKVIASTHRRNFVKVMCLWTLSEMEAKDLKPRLQALVVNASEEEDRFGGNIMDPRVCTHIPNVKNALKELLAKL